MPESDNWEEVADADDLRDGDVVKIGGYHRQYAVRVDMGRIGNPIRIKRDYHGSAESNVFYDVSVRELCALGLVQRKITYQPGQIWQAVEPGGPHYLYWLVTSDFTVYRLNFLAARRLTIASSLSTSVIPSDAELVLNIIPETA